MTRGILFAFALLACLFMLPGGLGTTEAEAATAAKSAVSSKMQAAEQAQVTEIKRGRRGRSWKRRGGFRRSWRGRRGGHWRGRSHWRHKRRFRRHRRYYGPGFGFGLFLGPRYYDYYDYRPYRYDSRCDKWRRRCADNWGYGNNNYYGCLRYHKCR